MWRRPSGTCLRPARGPSRATLQTVARPCPPPGMPDRPSAPRRAPCPLAEEDAPTPPVARWSRRCRTVTAARPPASVGGPPTPGRPPLGGLPAHGPPRQTPPPTSATATGTAAALRHARPGRGERAGAPGADRLSGVGGRTGQRRDDPEYARRARPHAWRSRRVPGRRAGRARRHSAARRSRRAARAPRRGCGRAARRPSRRWRRRRGRRERARRACRGGATAARRRWRRARRWRARARPCSRCGSRPAEAEDGGGDDQPAAPEQQCSTRAVGAGCPARPTDRRRARAVRRAEATMPGRPSGR